MTELRRIEANYVPEDQDPYVPAALSRAENLRPGQEIVGMAERIKGRPTVVDIRTDDEFKAGHLKGSTLVTWGEKDFEKQALAKLSKDKPVLVYCRSGRRSTAASEALAKLGFSKIHNLEGGITAWQKAGKEVTK